MIYGGSISYSEAIKLLAAMVNGNKELIAQGKAMMEATDDMVTKCNFMHMAIDLYFYVQSQESSNLTRIFETKTDSTHMTL